MNFDPVEAQDLTKLAVQVFRQALEDYVHLQHPATRTKKYVHEAFLSAVDLFWDPEYRIDVFKGDKDESLNLEDFLKLAADRSNLDLEVFSTFLQDQSKSYWKDKLMTTITVPEIMMVCEVPYDIRHHAETYRVDYDNRIVFLNKKPAEDNYQEFFAALVEIICYHKDLKVSKSNIRILGAALYDIMKINNSFKEPKAQKQMAQEQERSENCHESS